MLGFVLAGGALWYRERNRPQRPPVDTAPTVSAAVPDPVSNKDIRPMDTATPAVVATASPPPRARRRVTAVPESTSVPTASSDSLNRPDSAVATTPAADTIAANRSGGDNVSEANGGPGPISSDVDSAPIVPAPAPATDQVNERERAESRILAGVEQCYAALKAKDVARLTELYKPATREDEDKLKKLSRVLRTREWSADVGQRNDGLRQLGLETAAMEFSVHLSWKDAFGGHLNSQPVFRAEFTRSGDHWEMSSCRIVGSPRL